MGRSLLHLQVWGVVLLTKQHPAQRRLGGATWDLVSSYLIQNPVLLPAWSGEQDLLVCRKRQLGVKAMTLVCRCKGLWSSPTHAQSCRNQPAPFVLPRFHFRAVRSVPPCLPPSSPGRRWGYVLVHSVQGNTKWHPSILCFSSLPCPSAFPHEPCLQLWLQALRWSPPAAGSLPRQEGEGVPAPGFPLLWCAFTLAASALPASQVTAPSPLVWEGETRPSWTRSCWWGEEKQQPAACAASMPSLSPANLACWWQGAWKLCFLWLPHTALWILAQ